MIDVLNIYIPGYKPNQNILSLIKRTSKILKHDFVKIDYDVESEKNILEISRKIEKQIKLEIELKKRKIINLIGYSLGSAFAVEIGSRNSIPLNKIILISVFDDRKKLLENRKILIRNQENLSPIKKISKIKTPVTFIHGKNDRSIKSILAKRVFKKSNKNSSFIEIDSDHYFSKINQQKQLIDQLLFQLQ